MNLPRKIYGNTKNIILDTRASIFLKKVSDKRNSSGQTVKVAFIVFEPETWDKISGVYEALNKRENAEADIIIVPSFDQELKLTTHYGKELDFFKNVNSHSILAYEDNSWINLESRGYDYVFYQDPYNAHMPPVLRSDNVVKFAKICYIPYGFVGSDKLSELVTNKEFFRNVYFGFMDTKTNMQILSSRYKKNIKKGIQHFKKIGYPAYENFFIEDAWDGKVRKVLWTPRWTCDETIGKSHFFEYCNSIFDINNVFSDVKLIIRPHPMMFSNFINQGLMTPEEYEAYKNKLAKNGIELSVGRSVESDLKEADVLISDFSSIIPMFYFLGKPIIYTDINMELNEEYSRIRDNSYVAGNWKDIMTILKKLVRGEDYKLEARKKDIEQQYAEHHNATDRIVDCIINDYTNENGR